MMAAAARSGLIEKLSSGKRRGACTGPDGALYRAPVTFVARHGAARMVVGTPAEIEMQVLALMPRREEKSAARRSR